MLLCTVSTMLNLLDLFYIANDHEFRFSFSPRQDPHPISGCKGLTLRKFPKLKALVIELPLPQQRYRHFSDTMTPWLVELLETLPKESSGVLETLTLKVPDLETHNDEDSINPIREALESKCPTAELKLTVTEETAP